MTSAMQRTIVRVDGAPLPIVDQLLDPSAPTLALELGQGVQLVGSTVELIAFANAVVEAVDLTLGRTEVAS